MVRQTMEGYGGVVMRQLSIELVAAAGVKPPCELLKANKALVCHVLRKLLEPLNGNAVDTTHDLNARAVVPHFE